MLRDYIDPAERIVACPNQDVVYGLGIIDFTREPVVVQVPDFGSRFWVYQIVDERTDSFAKIGKMYDTKPGFYLLVGRAGVARCRTALRESFTQLRRPAW